MRKLTIIKIIFFIQPFEEIIKRVDRVQSIVDS